MIVTKEQQEALVDKYIKEKHNQDECIGFIDGINAALELVNKIAFNTPVMRSLPSDLKIAEWVKDHGYYGHCTQEYHEGLEEGAKWMKQLAEEGNDA